MHRRSRLFARRTALTGLAVFTLFSATGLAAWSRSATRSRQQAPDAAAIFQAMSQGHAEFRKAVLAELHKIATKRELKLDFPSLIITSCTDECMFAGIGTSRAPAKPEPQPKDPVGAAKLDTQEPLGLVVVAGTSLRVRSRTIDASGPAGQVPGKGEGAVGTVQLRPGLYLVRRGPRANLLELVDLEQKVAVTVPFQPGPGGRGKGERGAPDLNPELSDASAWPTIFMELLHAVDLSH